MQDESDDMAKVVAHRFRVSRLALGYENQRDFGEDAGLEQSHYSQFETEKRLLHISGREEALHSVLANPRLPLSRRPERADCADLGKVPGDRRRI